MNRLNILDRKVIRHQLTKDSIMNHTHRNTPLTARTRFIFGMHSLGACVAAAFVALAAPTGAFAQSKSSVDLTTAVATTAAALGSKAEQTIDVGSASNGGQANVRGTTFVASNAAALGSESKQNVSVGKADGSGSKSNVSVTTFVASNASALGSNSSQDIAIGQASNGGTSNVAMTTFVATGAAALGSSSKQTVNIGNAK